MKPRQLPWLALAFAGMLHVPARSEVVLREGGVGSGCKSASAIYNTFNTIGQVGSGAVADPAHRVGSGFLCERMQIALCDWTNHQVGNCILTVTDQGSLGFLFPPDSLGSGFIYPQGGENQLFVGSLWVGLSEQYVANRDYLQDPSCEWLPARRPDGHLWTENQGTSHQDICGAYTDSAAAQARGLRVEQESWAFSGHSLLQDVIVLTYRVRNESAVSMADLYAGVFLDLDVALSYDNTGGTNDGLNLVHLTAEGGSYVGLQLLQNVVGISPPRSNLTLISNPDYVYPNAYVPEADKYGFLSAADPQYVMPVTPEPNDYSVLVAAGPFTLAPGAEQVLGFAILGAPDLHGLEQRAAAAQLVWTSDFAEAEEDPELLLPSITRLLPARPNPFDRTTVVRFNLARSGRVRLSVYDVNGRMICALADGPHPAGRHAVSWQGRDGAGAPVGAGVYFVRLVTQERTQSKRVVRIR